MVVTAVRKTKENRRKANPKTMRAAKKSRITAQTMIIIGPRGTQPALLFSRERTPLCSTSRRRRSENSSPSKEAADFCNNVAPSVRAFVTRIHVAYKRARPFLGGKLLRFSLLWQTQRQWKNRQVAIVAVWVSERARESAKSFGESTGVCGESLGKFCSKIITIPPRRQGTMRRGWGKIILLCLAARWVELRASANRREGWGGVWRRVGREN